MNIKDIEQKYAEGVAFHLAGIDMEDHSKVVVTYGPPTITVMDDRYNEEIFYELRIDENILKIGNKRIWPLSYKEKA